MALSLLSLLSCREVPQWEAEMGMGQSSGLAQLWWLSPVPCHAEGTQGCSVTVSCKSEHPQHPAALMGKGSSSSCLNPARICSEVVAELPPQRCPCALPGDTCVTPDPVTVSCPSPPLQQEQAGSAAVSVPNNGVCSPRRSRRSLLWKRIRR